MPVVPKSLDSYFGYMFCFQTKYFSKKFEREILIITQSINLTLTKNVNLHLIRKVILSSLRGTDNIDTKIFRGSSGHKWVNGSELTLRMSAAMYSRTATM